MESGESKRMAKSLNLSPPEVFSRQAGLEAPVQQYPFGEWQLSGMDLLQLSYCDLEQLGVRKIGHQELILEAVEKLCSLVGLTVSSCLSSLVGLPVSSFLYSLVGLPVSSYLYSLVGLPVSSCLCSLVGLTVSSYLCSLVGLTVSSYLCSPVGLPVNSYLCSLTYSMSGENLRSLTEHLRNVAHSLQMGLQSRWRVNTYDGQSTTKLPSGVLRSVLELITTAKGLFSLLN
ncbi:hypothetical protein JZ751_011391, partial [Albula glossodonta]